MAPSSWLLLQLCDSSFPMGGFAHSGGLESAWQFGALGPPSPVRGWIESQLHQAAYSAAPLVGEAYRDPAAFTRWDLLADTYLSNHVANRASRTQGQSFAAAAGRIFGRPALLELAREVRRPNIFGHLAPVMGAACRALQLELRETLRLHLFTTLRGSLSSAVRLGVIGPIEAQKLQFELAETSERLLDAAMHLTADDIVQTMPLADLLQGTQDRLYSRLFQT